MALRASANAADDRRERKLRFEYVMLKAKGNLRLHTVHMRRHYSTKVLRLLL